jgi:hypothetical protein
VGEAAFPQVAPCANTVGVRAANDAGLRCPLIMAGEGQAIAPIRWVRVGRADQAVRGGSPECKVRSHLLAWRTNFDSVAHATSLSRSIVKTMAGWMAAHSLSAEVTSATEAANPKIPSADAFP